VINQLVQEVEIRHFHLFGGLGGGALGFSRGRAEVGNMRARFRCLGGIDNDPAACRDFTRRVGVRATCRDLFDREQYRDFHGCEPPADWLEATPADIRDAAGGERPHLVFLSSPCKGLSGLLSEAKSRSLKYQALNRLTVRGIWLMLEAWGDDPPELIVFENVPRIATRGRHLLDQIVALLRHYGYAVAETTHDCGEIGGLAQSRSMGQGPISVADPRLGAGPNGPHFNNVYRVVEWTRPSPTISAGNGPSAGGLGVADPRPPQRDLFGKYAVTPWEGPSGTVIGGDDSGAYAVADPRPPDNGHQGGGKYHVTPFDAPAGTVIAESGTGNGAFAVADPRALHREKGDHYLTGGHYGVVPWQEPAGAVPSAACHDNGPWSVADPRMPEQAQKVIAIIRSLDGTWHRPFTTLELAALQSLVDPEEMFDFDGTSDSAKRERIGNAVPPAAAQAVADLMGETLLLAWSGESFRLDARPVWVRPVAVALSVKLPEVV